MRSPCRRPGGRTRGGFTLIEVLVVIIIIGVLATLGVSKYTEFTTDSRKNVCVENQTGVDKGIGVWESQKVAITKSSRVTLTFNGGGDITATGGNVPAGLNSGAATTAAQDNNRRSIGAFIRDDNIFMCPEFANQQGGFGAVSRATNTFFWISDLVQLPALNNNRRGVCCMNFSSANGVALLNGADGTARTAHR